MVPVPDDRIGTSHMESSQNEWVKFLFSYHTTALPRVGRSNEKLDAC